MMSLFWKKYAFYENSIFGKNWPPRACQRAFKKTDFFGVLRYPTIKVVFFVIFLLGWSSIKFWALHTAGFVSHLIPGPKSVSYDGSKIPRFFGGLCRNFRGAGGPKNGKLWRFHIYTGGAGLLFAPKKAHFLQKKAKKAKKFLKKGRLKSRFSSANTRFFRNLPITVRNS